LLNKLTAYHLPETEQAFIRECVSSKTFAVEYSGKVTVDHFALPYAREALRAIQKAVSTSDTPDIVYLDKTASQATIDWLMGILADGHGVANPRLAIENLEKAKFVRNFGVAASKLIGETETGVPDIEAAISSVAKVNTSAQNIYTMGKLSKNAVERWESATGQKIVRFNIPKLDRHLRLKLGDLVYIIAPPKAGKTWLLVMSAIQIGAQHPVDFISCEMAPDDLYTRVCSYVTGRDCVPLETPDAPRRTYQAWAEKLEYINSLNVRFVRAIGISLIELMATIRMSARRGARVVIIDYLQRILNPHAKDIRIAVAQVSTALADLSKELGILIICASQAGRAARQTGETQTYHGRESGSIEADADAIVAVTSESGEIGNPNKLKLRIEQRNGDTGMVVMMMNPATGHVSGNEDI